MISKPLLSSAWKMPSTPGGFSDLTVSPVLITNYEKGSMQTKHRKHSFSARKAALESDQRVNQRESFH